MKELNSILYAFSLLGQLGFIMMANILVAVGLYKLLEKITGNNGLVFILFVLLGIGGGFYSAYKLIFVDKKNKEE